MSHEENAGAVPLRVLFIGNSLTYRGGGLDNHFRTLLPCSVTGRVVKGGWTLDRLLPMAENEILRKIWDFVLFQDDLPETSLDKFRESASAAAELARRAGTSPLFLETWPYERLDWIDGPGITDAVAAAGSELNVPIIPAGSVWRKAASEMPELVLYDTDREHPSIAGSYLTACVLASALTSIQGGDSPSHSVPATPPNGLSTSEAEQLLSFARHAA